MGPNGIRLKIALNPQGLRLWPESLQIFDVFRKCGFWLAEFN